MEQRLQIRLANSKQSDAENMARIKKKLVFFFLKSSPFQFNPSWFFGVAYSLRLRGTAYAERLLIIVNVLLVTLFRYLMYVPLPSFRVMKARQKLKALQQQVNPTATQPTSHYEGS